MSDEPPTDEEWSFADRLNYLFTHFTKPDGQQYTHEEVQQKTEITTGYISKLRHGKATNPGYKVVGVLARFFGVSPNFFYIEDRETAVREVQHTIHLNPITMRASELSPKSRQAVLDMLEHIVSLEDLDSGRARDEGETGD